MRGPECTEHIGKHWLLAHGQKWIVVLACIMHLTLSGMILSHGSALQACVGTVAHTMSMQLPEDKRKKILDKAFGAMEHWLERFDTVIIGPGLGRDEMVHEVVIQVMCPRLF